MKQPRKRAASPKPRPLKNTAPSRWFQLKITLQGTRPAIWRRLAVRGDIRLDLLHTVIQLAMGWSDSHLHMFLVGADCYSDPAQSDGLGFPGEEKDKDERRVSLATIADAHYRTIGYQYDFGDSWDHLIVIEKELAPLQGDEVAACLAGKGACPPEDCGGVPGFAGLVRAMKKAKGSEYLSYFEWLGGAFDPDAFSVVATNARLSVLRWPQVQPRRVSRKLTLDDPTFRN